MENKDICEGSELACTTEYKCEGVKCECHIDTSCGNSKKGAYICSLLFPMQCLLLTLDDYAISKFSSRSSVRSSHKRSKPIWCCQHNFAYY